MLWLLAAQPGTARPSGHGREDLTVFEEEFAYGLEAMEPDGKDERKMKLLAWEDRTIRLAKTEDGK